MKLSVTNRSLTGKKVKNLRNEGLIPAVVYGNHLDGNTSISLIKNDFLKLYRKRGISLPIELDGDIKEMVIVKDYAVDPVTDELLHVDFLAVKKDQEVETHVPLVFIGESKVEKAKLGQLQYVKDSLAIKAKPGDLVAEIKVNVASIKEVSDVMFVSDVVLPKGVELIDDPEISIITVKSFAAMDAEAEAAEADAPALAPEQAEGGEEVAE